MLRSIPAAAAATALLAAALAGASSGQPAPGAAPPGLETAIAATQKHGEELLDRPGVAGVGVGVDRNGEPVVEIFKETGDVPGLPRSLEGMPVRFVTTGIIEARAPTDRFPRPVPIGVSAGHYQLATGTLGARVTDGTNVYALSNNHVFAGINTASIGDPILQPGPIEDGGVDPADRIGTLYAYQPIDFNGGDNTMDAAIALTSSSSVGTSTPPDGYGAPSALTAPASIGLPVQKYGRTTGFQLGQVEQVNVSVDVCYLLLFDICLQEARFVNQISISPGPFSAAGDSGSLIVTQSGNQPVALLFAGGDGLTIGTPIDTVLQRFGVTIDGAPPEDGPPGAPTALSALAGDASVSLSWSPPSFDGGSPVTSYRVYRGTSPGSETFLADAGPATSYLDTSAVNGTTYFYKVTAVNANGEGPLSNGASATPTSLVPPAEPLPTVDDFNRANETLSDAGRWTNGVNGSVETGLQVSANQLACTKTSTCTAWRNTSQYGPDTEVWARLAVKPGDNNQLRLYARLQQVGTSTYDGYMLRPNQLAGTDQVLFERVDNGAIVNLLTVSQELAAGDTFLLRVTGSTIEAWRHDGSGWSRLGTVSDSTYSGAGYAGLGMRGTTGRADDFGARSLSQSPPGAPTALSALAGDASVSLSWSPPSFDGGSPVTSYRVYRGTSPGSETFLADAGPATSYLDTSAVNGTTYFYKVTAVNANGEGPLSNGASATPTSLVPPAEPLPTVDDFNRANETLSDAGRWTNGVNGSVETGLQVSANQLACTKTSTCTAWRNTSQYGPDTEVWARLAVKPGDNNQLRLYARLQQVGTSTYDGYMLRPNQLAGTDQVLFERVDNGAIVNLLTVSQELAAGDTFLLRVTGSTIEAWRHDGSGWSRLGTVSDSTYSGAGYAGLGMRGTTGRADDFGARNVGAPPADTEAPGAPASLQASAAGSSQIDLTWLAATDNVGVAQYRIERCQGTGCSSFTEIATTASTSYSDAGLAASTSYSYRVRAEDAAGNQGPYSETASATTAGAPDTEAPSAPASLQASAAGSSQIDLTWLAATDNVGVAQYRIERCQGTGCSSFTEIATTASTSYSDAGLAASTSYSYRVRAEDAAGNQGPYSETASATTGAGAVPPVEPLPALDGFDRRNENPLSDQGRWSNGVIGSSETGLRVSSRKLSCTRTTTCTAWRNTSAFGPDTEVWARISTLPGTNNQFRLYARLQQPGSSANDGYMLRTNQLTGTDEVYLERIDNGAIVRLGTFAQDLAVGDVLLFRAAGSALEAWHRRGTTWSLVGSTSDSTYAAAGYIGVGIRGKTGRLDDFGGR